MKQTHPNVDILCHVLFPLFLRLHAITRIDFTRFENLQHRFRLEEPAAVRRCLCEDPSVPLGFKHIGVDNRVVVDTGRINMLGGGVSKQTRSCEYIIGTHNTPARQRVHMSGSQRGIARIGLLVVSGRERIELAARQRASRCTQEDRPGETQSAERR